MTATARALGTRRTKAYQLAKQGEIPCRVIRVGTTTTSPLLTYYGYSA